ncbi:MAG TPA: peptidoglycan editing factor PgeF [Candidatus Moranbacteria bacterium]|jgi:hypothetical protein|nr:peptidoglycan editing factor PgeF [Candidatus Moranbacteria bacterium]HOF42464.1 peptidoglycan editing factor PgeF [Candidatus Moranbacteria bacterium]HPX94711.1 peptidoglycan editing factor PgeF [Candidatus Moranbacteria bacterium]HQB59166.1 peptidoglycan editing factor PgeF [Candidatus Moranbacteria bacterium]
MLKFFEKFSEVFAIMSEKTDGSMKLLDGEKWEENLKNRNKFFNKNEINPNKVTSVRLVHGSKVLAVKNGAEKIVEDADGLVTSESNIFLAVTVSDCIPVYFYEKEKKIVGIAHAGWRGIVGGIVENAIGEILKLGGKVENMYIALGPGINSCHFEIKKDVLNEFRRYDAHVLRREEKIFVDLKGIIREQLLSRGIKEGSIEDNKACTYCSENFFSFRRDKTNETMVAAIGLKN